MLSILLLSVKATNYQVSVGPNNMYYPSEVNADVGDTVSWTLNAPYSVTQVSSECSALAGGFDSEVVSSMQMYSHTFSKPGKYRYVSQKHCQNGMWGVVNVKDTYSKIVNPFAKADQKSKTAHAAKAFAKPSYKSKPTAKPTIAVPVYVEMSESPVKVPSHSCNVPPMTHTIQVAPSGALVYSMPTIKVTVGDSIIWMAGKKNHTVTQVDSKSSCVKSTGGFNSGLIIDPNSFTQVFNTIGKTWYTCLVPGHCQAGMRGLVIVVDCGTTVLVPPPVYTVSQEIPECDIDPPSITLSTVLFDSPTPIIQAYSQSSASYAPTVATVFTSSCAIPPTIAPTFTSSCVVLPSISPLVATSCNVPPVTHTIQIAPSGVLVYSKPTMQVTIGDSVSWMAGKKNHTVTQVSDGISCVKSISGFNSGLIIDPNSFTQMFNTIGKTWYTCLVPGHCQAGMRGVINVVACGTVSATSTVVSLTTPAADPLSLASVATAGSIINSAYSPDYDLELLAFVFALTV